MVKRLVVGILLILTTTTSSGMAFSWRERISIRDIPEEPLSGMLNGERFGAVCVRIKDTRGKPGMVRLEIYNKKPNKKCGIVWKACSFKLWFPKNTKSKTWSMNEKKSSKEASAGYTYVKEKGKLQAISTDWAAAIIIDSWNDETLNGKVAICFKEKDGYKNWIAGRFEARECLK